MLQQAALIKGDPQLFGYKKPVPLISTSCVRHCEKSQWVDGFDARQRRTAPASALC
jgi:hypothetical protein